MKTEPNDPIGSLVNPIAVSNYLVVKDGLNKRELFAAMAMQGNIAKYGSANPTDTAQSAVLCADALIAALNNTSTTN